MNKSALKTDVGEKTVIFCPLAPGGILLSMDGQQELIRQAHILLLASNSNDLPASRVTSVTVTFQLISRNHRYQVCCCVAQNHAQYSCALYIKYTMWLLYTPPNPSFIILKITSPRKTPDATTVSADGLGYAESRSSVRAARAASHFKAKRNRWPVVLAEVIWESWPLTTPPGPRSRPTVRASKGSTLKPLHRALGFKVRGTYPLLRSSAEHRCHFSRLVREIIRLRRAHRLLHTQHLRNRKEWDDAGYFRQDMKANRQFLSRIPARREPEVVLTLASLLQLFTLWPH